MDSIYDHFLFCTILYLRVPIAPCPRYSFSLVYVDKHLYEKYLNNEGKHLYEKYLNNEGKHLYDNYLNNEPYENKSNKLGCLGKSQLCTIVYLQVPYVMYSYGRNAYY